MFNYPYDLQNLINEISKLPGIGPKMAERTALYILKKGVGFIDGFSAVLQRAKTIGFCPECFNVSGGGGICGVCADNSRDRGIVCVVESPEDVVNIENTGKYSGYYHVLHGLINPLNNILPENLKLRELLKKKKEQENIREILLALNHTVEGDTTVLYISDMFKEKSISVKITRLAKGLPTGSDIRYADEITLGQAIEGRKEI